MNEDDKKYILESTAAANHFFSAFYPPPRTCYEELFTWNKFSIPRRMNCEDDVAVCRGGLSGVRVQGKFKLQLIVQTFSREIFLNSNHFS